MLQRLIRKSLRTILHCSSELRNDAEIELQTARDFTPETVIRGYLAGCFPMPADGRVVWKRPERRAVFPIETFHISRNLQRLMRQRKFEIRIDSDFDQVSQGCANRDDTWLSPEVRRIYAELFRMGLVRTIETWQNGEMVGGVYGVSIGKFFAGESQFSRVRDAGKVAFASLFEMLRANRFQLHDGQYLTPYLKQFGATEISRTDFESKLLRAAAQPGAFRHPEEIRDRNEVSILS
jgi:leucyl/phenylalanyl-tRNA---protein transferase